MSVLANGRPGKPHELPFVVALALGLLSIAQISSAGEPLDRSPTYREHEFSEREFHEPAFLDSRYHHDHYYPPVGFSFGTLPIGHVAVTSLGVNLYFAGGVWYRTAGPARFVVISPPVGVLIPVLPPFYSTVWVGGTLYYYANNAYYVQGAGGYVVVNPPPTAGVVEMSPSGPMVQQSAAGSVYQTPIVPLSIYPKHGQSLNQQATDRYECQRWASSQSGYDPSNGRGATEHQTETYTQGMRACLSARGYTVW